MKMVDFSKKLVLNLDNQYFTDALETVPRDSSRSGMTLDDLSKPISRYIPYTPAAGVPDRPKFNSCCNATATPQERDLNLF
jgi:hypothetical protein